MELSTSSLSFRKTIYIILTYVVKLIGNCFVISVRGSFSFLFLCGINPLEKHFWHLAHSCPWRKSKLPLEDNKHYRLWLLNRPRFCTCVLSQGLDFEGLRQGMLILTQSLFFFFLSNLISKKDDILISISLSLSLDWFPSWEGEELIIIEHLKPWLFAFRLYRSKMRRTSFLFHVI